MRYPAASLIACSCLILSACGDDEPGGTYLLVSVEGADLPAVIHRSPGMTGTVLSGSVVMAADSLHQHETHRTSSSTGEIADFQFVTATRYEVDGSIVRTIPEAFESVPMFSNCTTSGVFRIEDGGDQLRLVDLAMDGDCDGLAPFEVLERVYRRD